MNYVFYGLCGTVLYYLFSFYSSYSSLKNRVEYLESIIGFQKAKVNLFEREISIIYNKLEKQRGILEKEISIIYDTLEK